MARYQNDLSGCGGQTKNLDGVLVRNSFEHLGHVVWAKGAIDLPKEKLQALRKFIRHHLYRLHQNLTPQNLSHEEHLRILSKNFSKLCCSSSFQTNPIQSLIWGISDKKRLNELDRWVALLILSFTFGGYSKRHFRNYPIRKLRKIGLSSFIHLRNTGALRILQKH